MIQRILVPLDGSAPAEQVIPHAQAMAAAFGSEVFLMHVMAAASARSASSVDWRLRKLETERYLEEVGKRLAPEPVERLVAIGNPPEQILAAVERHAIDLLVLSRYGEGGLTEFHLSGTASKLVGSATCSILLVSPGGTAKAAAEAAAYRKVLVAVDCSKRSEWAVCLASTVARATGAELLLVHVAALPETVEPAAGDAHAVELAGALRDANRAAAVSYLQALVARLCTPGARVRHRIVDDPHVEPALLRVAAEEAASVIVLSAHGHAPAAGVPYGGIARGVIADATMPVLLLQDTPARPHAVPAAAGWAAAGTGR